MSADALEQYLNAMGIIGCNVNPYLPALDDLGFCWQDMTALLDRQGLFTAKVYRRRTVYLSPEVYHLLRQLRARRPMPPDAAALHAVLGGSPPLETGELKRLSRLDGRTYAKSFDFLMEHLYITAIRSGRRLNENWSTLLYGTAEAWEALAPPARFCDDPAAALRAILGRTLPETEVAKLLR